MKNRPEIRITEHLGARVPNPAGPIFVNPAVSTLEPWWETVLVKLTWRDRLRLLFGRKLDVYVQFDGRPCAMLRSVVVIHNSKRRARALEAKLP